MAQIVTVSLIIGVLIGSWLVYFLTKSGRRKYETQAEPVRFSVKEAEGMLGKAGYEILDKQPRRTVITVINGKEHFGYVEADYLVRKHKNRYVVVVKSGEGAADPNEPVLRRRFLEHDYVFSPDGLLLLDLERGEIHQVGFYFPRERSIDIFFKFLIVLFVIFLVIGIIWLLAALKLI